MAVCAASKTDVTQAGPFKSCISCARTLASPDQVSPCPRRVQQRTSTHIRATSALASITSSAVGVSAVSQFECLGEMKKRFIRGRRITGFLPAPGSNASMMCQKVSGARRSMKGSATNEPTISEAPTISALTISSTGRFGVRALACTTTGTAWAAHFRFTKSKDCAVPATTASNRSDSKTIRVSPSQKLLTIVIFGETVMPALQPSSTDSCRVSARISDGHFGLS